MCKGRIVRESTGYQLPEVGKVKIGMKSDKGYPMSLDYFLGFGNKLKIKHYERRRTSNPESIF